MKVFAYSGIKILNCKKLQKHCLKYLEMLGNGTWDKVIFKNVDFNNYTDLFLILEN